MKKIAIAVCALVLSGSALFASDWRKVLALDISVPFGFYSHDGHSFNEHAVIGGVDFFVVKQDIKLAIKADLKAGATLSSDIANEASFGYFRAMAGAGYAPFVEDKFTVAVFGMAGYYRSDNWDKTSVAGIDIENRNLLSSFVLGVDATGVYRLSRRFGLYANLGIYFPVGGNLNAKIKYKDVPSSLKDTLKDSSSDVGYYGVIVEPSFGISWTY